jgi:hypothetical protein
MVVRGLRHPVAYMLLHFRECNVTMAGDTELRCSLQCCKQGQVEQEGKPTPALLSRADSKGKRQR